MAKTKTKTNRRRRHNATRIIVAAPPRRHNRRRRHNTTAHRRRRHNTRRQRRNPELFGHRLASGGTGKMIFGGLLGVTSTKLLVSYMPTSLTASPVLAIVTSGAAAWVSGMVASKLASAPFGDAVLFGGLMQTASVALNAFVPSIAKSIALSGVGMGDLVAGAFPVPSNPLFPQRLPGYVQPQVAAPAPRAAGPRMTMNGLTRSFGTAF